jgi:pilus assembly protein CpaC
MSSGSVRKYAIFCFLFVISFVCLSAKAEVSDYLGRKEIMLIIGETKPLSVNNPKQVKIGNPKLLDVVGASRNELLLSGLSEGETLLTIADSFGQHIYNVSIFEEDLEKLKERIDALLESAGFDRLTTKIGDKERKIFIMGKFPNSKKDFFESKIDSIKDKIINLVEYYEDTPSVEIDVEVLEIEKAALDTLGLSWDKSISYTGDWSETIPEILNPAQTVNILTGWSTGNYNVTLNFLKQRNQARTLSRPKIVCLSGKEAKLLVGGERPIITGSTSTTTASGTATDYNVELKEYGITLTIKPIVRENEEIQVALQTEISEIDTSQSLTIGGSTTPGFTMRTAETELTVMNGQTVFLAGLIKSKHEDERDAIKGLSSIPFLGAIFRNRDSAKRDTEIVITLTPTIIRNKAIQNISSATPAQNYSLSKYSVRSDTIKTQVIKEEDPTVDYSNLIQNIINSNIAYPQELSSANIEGSVKLSIHLLASGELSGVVIMKSSGHQLLDEAAEYAVRQLSPFPAFPSEVKLKELWIDMPIVYRSKNRT